ncbi:putative Transporter of MFS family, contains Lipocalin domain [Nitrospira japonica]|uniref:Putative Transporter of MFS family, contains Lipocalin domain n=1 Tax=Nitrospira japonica TaxID=1325564 RepID=A0A1W1I663_9BACT|nr:MFS transporter [Nitrospira japonica]SLM48431.1 putative Transporter of MFS family, contains Lipocalin domain [Nitrospira japonica]
MLDGASQAVTQGSGEHFLSAFALLLHAGPFQLGILSALPQLIGTTAQLASVKLLRCFPDRKSLVRLGTVGQALSWIPILLLPLAFPAWGPWLLIMGAAIYFACNHFTAPTWTSFIADHLDQHERGAYFARRASIVAAVSFGALCAAGGLLSLWPRHTAWIGFVLIFLAAGTARLFSAAALRPVPDLPHREPRSGHEGFRVFLRNSSRSFRRFLLFSSLMHLAVLIAGPYFVLYMLRDLHFSYLTYGAWLAAGVLGQLLTLQGWGRFADRFGNKALLSITGFIVPILPMFYMVTTNAIFIMGVNFFSGMIWAGLALGLQNYVFDAVPEEDRATAVAVYSTLNAVGWCCGALMGSWLIAALPSRFEWAGWSWGSSLPVVFFVSGVLRLLISVGLMRQFHEPRAVEQAPLSRLLLELPLLTPVRHIQQWIASPLLRLGR